MLTMTVCIALSAAGLAVSLLTAYRRRYRAAVRTAAFALLPVGLFMTGLITLGGRIGSAVGTWASGLVFDPAVWAGFGVLALSVVLFVSTRFGARGTPAARRERKSAAGPTAAALPKAESKAKPASRGDEELSDFSDIEEILKRRGI